MPPTTTSKTEREDLTSDLATTSDNTPDLKETDSFNIGESVDRFLAWWNEEELANPPSQSSAPEVTEVVTEAIQEPQKQDDKLAIREQIEKQEQWVLDKEAEIGIVHELPLRLSSHQELMELYLSTNPRQIPPRMLTGDELLAVVDFELRNPGSITQEMGLGFEIRINDSMYKNFPGVGHQDLFGEKRRVSEAGRDIFELVRNGYNPALAADIMQRWVQLPPHSQVFDQLIGGTFGTSEGESSNAAWFTDKLKGLVTNQDKALQFLAILRQSSDSSAAYSQTDLEFRKLFQSRTPRGEQTSLENYIRMQAFSNFQFHKESLEEAKKKLSGS